MEIKTWKHFTAFLCCAGFLLALSGAQEKDPITPLRKAVVKFGHFFVLNCTTNGGSSSSNSSCDIQERSSHNYDYKDDGSTWKTFTFIVSYWSLSASCVVTCNNEPRSWETIVTVYQPPERIELDPVPEMEVGKQYNLTCWVFGVAPIRNLTVTLLKGEEQLLVKTFEDHTRPGADDVVGYHCITAQQNDYNKTITCQTSLDLRPTGPLLKNTSHGISLWTFDFAKAPLLHTGLFLEAGTLMKVTCDAPEVFPADAAMFDLRFAGTSLTLNTTVMGGSASAQAVISSSSVGDHELICNVSLGPVTKNVTKMVNVFALPKLILQIDSSEAVVNQTVNITCSAGGSASPGFTLQIMDAAKILASGNVNEYFLQHAVTAQQEDNEREFICQVTLIIDGQTKERNISQNLTVFYGPQMDDSNCPHALTWKEGSTTSFTCSALGNPTPTVQCWKDGRLYNLGEPQLVQREHDGVYHCNATNQYGFDARDVAIRVESYQPNILAIIMGTVAVVLIFISLGAMAFYKNKKKFRIYHLWKRQQPQAAGTSELLPCLNRKTNN